MVRGSHMQVFYRCCRHCYPTDQFHQSGMKDRHAEPCMLCPDGRANRIEVENKRMIEIRV